MAISPRMKSDVWVLELDALAAEIVALSGLTLTRLDEAATELSAGLDLYREDRPSDKGAYVDPYDWCLAFAAGDGVEQYLVDADNIADLSRRQIRLAIAFHYVDLARWLARNQEGREEWNEVKAAELALWHKMAARKITEDSVRRMPARSIPTTG